MRKLFNLNLVNGYILCAKYLGNKSIYLPYMFKNLDISLIQYWFYIFRHHIIWELNIRYQIEVLSCHMEEAIKINVQENFAHMKGLYCSGICSSKVIF